MPGTAATMSPRSTEWRKAAIAGDADAQFNLGQAYKLGRGVPVDLPMAESWYRKAALQGHPQAEDNYGLALFQDGKRAEARAVARKGGRARRAARPTRARHDAVQRRRRAARLGARLCADPRASSAAGLPQAIADARRDGQVYPRPTSASRASRSRGNMRRRSARARLSARSRRRQRRHGSPDDRVPSTSRPNAAPGAPIRQPGKPPRAQPPAVCRGRRRRPSTCRARSPRRRPAACPAGRRAAGGWRVQLGAFGDATPRASYGARSAAASRAARQVS